MKHSSGLAVAALLVLAGCVATTNPTSPGLENEVFTDLPAADGLKYDKGYGQKTPSGGLREYKQDYSGSRRLDDVKEFYEKALPHHGWMSKGSEGTDPVTLTFEKRMEKVHVKIWNDGGLIKVNVHVTGK